VGVNRGAAMDKADGRVKVIIAMAAQWQR